MNYFNLGSELNHSDLNGLVYLLRKFKRLTSKLKLNKNNISSEYGNYLFSDGLTSIGENYIIEENVSITSNDVLLNCFYTFKFTAIDVNLSGNVNRRIISITGNTGNDGILDIVLSSDMLESDEILVPEFEVDIVFDEHEYYTPVSSLDITLEVDKSYVGVGDVATITATVLDDSGSTVSGLDLLFNINDVIVTDTTDSEGVASVNYTGTGNNLWVNVSVSGENVRFYDGEIFTVEFSGNNIKLGSLNIQWLYSDGDVIVDWGDGTENIINNPKPKLTHSYDDGLSSHDIKFIGIVTGLGEYCFNNCTGLVSAIIPSTVTSIGRDCFDGCSNLTSIIIPNSVTSLKEYCFYKCSSLSSITIPSSVTSLGESCFDGCSSLTSVVIPQGVRSLGFGCFWDCTSLTSVTIPSSVTSVGNYCFASCTSLVEYQLYWENSSILVYSQNKMPNKTGTRFYVPQGQKNVYTNGYYKYPLNKVYERTPSTKVLTISCPVQPYADGTTDIRGKLTDSGTPLEDETVNIYEGSTLVGTGTTNQNGYYYIVIPANTFDAGQHTLKAVSGETESQNLVITVKTGYEIDISCSTPIIQSGDRATITATVTRGGESIGNFQRVDYVIKHGSTVIRDGGTSTDYDGKIDIRYDGTGVGKVTFEVSYTDYGGTSVQEIYEIKDCIAFDSAILNDAHLHNEYWIKQYSSLVADVTNNGTSIIGGRNGQGYLFNKPNTSTDAYNWDNNICIEFDVYELVGNPAFQIRDATNNKDSYFLSSVGVTDGSHVKIIFTDGNTDNFRIMVDGIEKTPKTINNIGLVRIGFLVSTTTGLTFKNFAVYPV